jgi:hypothetical protein
LDGRGKDGAVFHQLGSFVETPADLSVHRVREDRLGDDGIELLAKSRQREIVVMGKYWTFFVDDGFADLFIDAGVYEPSVRLQAEIPGASLPWSSGSATP